MERRRYGIVYCVACGARMRRTRRVVLRCSGYVFCVTCRTQGCRDGFFNRTDMRDDFDPLNDTKCPSSVSLTPL